MSVPSSTIDEFEVSAGDAVSSCRTSASVTVRAARTTQVIHGVVEIIHRTVRHALVLLTSTKTLGTERQSGTIARAALRVTLQATLLSHFTPAFDVTTNNQAHFRPDTFRTTGRQINAAKCLNCRHTPQFLALVVPVLPLGSQFQPTRRHSPYILCASS